MKCSILPPQGRLGGDFATRSKMDLPQRELPDIRLLTQANKEAVPEASEALEIICLCITLKLVEFTAIYVRYEYC